MVPKRYMWALLASIVANAIIIWYATGNGEFIFRSFLASLLTGSWMILARTTEYEK